MRPSVGVILGLISIVGVTGCGLSLPTPEEFLSGLNAILLRPDATCEELRSAFGLDHRLPLVATPDGAGLVYEDHFIPGPDGQDLHAWYIPAKLDRGVVIISNGAPGPMSCYLFTGRLLAQNGWSVVMYEYRGYGQSSGVPSLLVLRADLETVLDWTLRRTGRPQASLLGISLGTLPSIAVAARRPDAVNAIILDSPVVLGEEITRFGFLFGGQQNLLIPYLGEDLRSEQLIQTVIQPKLVLLHERDFVTPPSSVELLYNLAPPPKDLVRFPALYHAYGQFYMTDVFAYHVDTFLAAAWQRSR